MYIHFGCRGRLIHYLKKSSFSLLEIFHLGPARLHYNALSPSFGFSRDKTVKICLFAPSHLYFLWLAPTRMWKFLWLNLASKREIWWFTGLFVALPWSWTSERMRKKKYPHWEVVIFSDTVGVCWKMGTWCERCRRRDEQDYRNLDDCQKHFLLLMMGDFQHEIVSQILYYLWKCNAFFSCPLPYVTFVLLSYLQTLFFGKGLQTQFGSSRLFQAYNLDLPCKFPY